MKDYMIFKAWTKLMARYNGMTTKEYIRSAIIEKNARQK